MILMSLKLVNIQILSSNCIILYLNTIKYLRWEQIVFRIWYSVRKKGLKFLKQELNVVPEELNWEILKSKIPFLEYPNINAHDIMNNRFTFLNDSIHFKDIIDWKVKNKNKLWKYNLHYFQYLRTVGGIDSNKAMNIIMNWIDQNPIGTSGAWDPYTISLRIVNWIIFMIGMDIPKDDCYSIYRSLYQQTLWLEKFIEYDQLGNHLIKNSKALIFAGLLFKSKDADRWFSKGVHLLERELDEQILEDGGHFERSPMYHCMILEDCIDLLNIFHNYIDQNSNNLKYNLTTVAYRMVEFLQGIIHPDGQIPLFNDAAFGIEACPFDLISYFEKISGICVNPPKNTIRSFPDSGYFIMTPSPKNFLIIDCGPIGPEYQPGHGHCDTLSFELSLNRVRVIVDSGCFTYTNEKIRLYNRGNAGHNVLTLNNENQSEVWSSFRCGRRAYPLKPKIWIENKTLNFEGGHDGYRHLKGKPITKRNVSWKGKRIKITDILVTKKKHNFETRLHFNPLCEIILENDIANVIFKKQIILVIQTLNHNKMYLNKGLYSPEFGKYHNTLILTQNGQITAPYIVGWELQIP